MNSQAWNASNFLPLALLPGESIRMKSIVAIAAAAFALGAVPAVAADMMDPWSQMLVKPMTPAETAQPTAERDAANGNWATLPPAPPPRATRSMRGTHLADPTAMPRLPQQHHIRTTTNDPTA